jgi:hypothetical protein
MVYTVELEKEYINAARNYAVLWGVNDEHVIRLMTSIMLDRDDIIPGGGFVKAVNRNDLRGAINMADPTSLANLKVLVATKHDCYVIHNTY